MPAGLNSAAFAAGHPPSADARLAAEIADLFLPDHARLDERTRRAVSRRLDDVVAAIEDDLRRGAARALAAAGDDAAAAIAGGGGSRSRLTEAGALDDPALIGELIAQERLALLAEQLPVSAEAGEGPGLLLHLAELPDRVVAAAARALLTADGDQAGARADLPFDLYRRLVWLVAAAIRETAGAVADRALAEAAQRCLAAHDEGERRAALAVRLVAAIDPVAAEMPALLLAAIGDRRPALFAALLAHAVAIAFEDARALLLDPAGEVLWPALRVAGLGRADLARVALALADADPRRDIEAFADRLDDHAAIGPAQARAMLAPLTLPSDYRRAIGLLAARR